MGESNSGATSQFVLTLHVDISTASILNEFYRNDAGATITQNTLDGAGGTAGYWDNADHVYGYTDTTTQLQAYKDGVGSGLRNYSSSRTGSMTIDTFNLGAYRRTSISLWFAARFYFLIAYKGVLSAPNIASLNTYAGTKCGLVL